MAIASFVIMGLGVLLILIGIYISLVERNRRLQKEQGGTVKTDEMALN
jgi:uncharacterized membrane protein